MMDDHATGLPDDWTTEQRELFSRVLRNMLADQHLFTHPKAAPIPAEHWQTTAWNAAWCAALFSDGDLSPLVHLDEDGNIIGSEITMREMN